MSLLAEILLSALLVLGGLFGLIGSWGLIRLREPMQRLHAPTKATTVGVGTALVAAGTVAATQAATGAPKEALVSLFLFLTAPVSALMLARCHLWRGGPSVPLPPDAGGSGWAVRAGATAPEDAG